MKFVLVLGNHNNKQNRNTMNKVSYKSTELTAEQKLNYKRCVVQSQDGIFYLFASEAASVAIIGPREVYKNWDDFNTRAGTNEPLLESLHQQLFESAPTKAEKKDLMELSIKVWMRLCETSMNRISNDPGSTKGQAKLQNRIYEVLTTEVPANVKLPPQAKTCLLFFAEQIKPLADAKIASGIALADVGVLSVSEAEHMAYVKLHAERLKTRQDPWRIFQYYRPQLIAGHFIRMV